MVSSGLAWNIRLGLKSLASKYDSFELVTKKRFYDIDTRYKSRQEHSGKNSAEEQCCSAATSALAVLCCYLQNF